MEILHYLLPVVFAAGSVQHHQTSSTSNTNSSSWECLEVVKKRTWFLGYRVYNKNGLIEKCFPWFNTSRMTDLVDGESSLEFHLLRDEDFSDKEDGSMSRIKRNDITDIKTDVCSQKALPLSSTKAILNPVVYPIIVILGLALNGVLLHIYWKHDELRTQRNAVFMNLAVSDTLFLLVFGGFKIFSSMSYLETQCLPPYLCKMQVFCLCVWASVGAYSITLISIQRYIRMVKFKKHVINRYVKFFLKPACLITTLWTLSILLAVPEVARPRLRNQGFRCKDPNLFVHGAYPFVVYGVLPGTIATGFYWVVQRRPLQERLGPEFPKKDRPGRVLLSLGVVYVLTYVPVLVCDILSTDEEIYCYISKLLHMLNPILCPIALCFASGRLRRYFIQHLLCLCFIREVNDSSATNLFETGHFESRVTSPVASSPDHRSGAFEMTGFTHAQEATGIPVFAD